MPHAYVTAYTCDCMYMCYMKQSCALVPNRLASSLTHSHSSMAPGESRPSSATYTLCDLVLCLVTQSCPTLATPWTVAHQAPLSMGILQATIVEWVAMPSSRGSSQPMDQT